ncbi:MAG: Ldh family oxidoreductase [Sulfitobacter sp.]
MNDEIQFISEDDLIALTMDILLQNGCSTVVARQIAENCVTAERGGSLSHGVFRIDGYVRTLRSGWVDGSAVPVLNDMAPGFIAVDAKNGFAQPALSLAREAFVEKIKGNGIALLGIGNAHHFSSLWPDILPFAESGFIALSMVNSFACSVPQGAKSSVLGTNPIAFAAPVDGQPPLVFDFATTTMAHGDIQIAAKEGRKLPAGTGVDCNGDLTDDPDAILNGGALVPFGGHKGSAISLMIELLTAGLSGGNFSFEFDWSTHPGAETPRTGQIIIGIDPSYCGQGNGLSLRAVTLMKMLEDAGFDARPGLRRHRLSLERRETGIPLKTSQLTHLRALAVGAARPD